MDLWVGVSTGVGLEQNYLVPHWWLSPSSLGGCLGRQPGLMLADSHDPCALDAEHAGPW